MAHREQQIYFATVKKHLPRYFSHTKVLEIGALDINGSCREHFEQADYCGVDLDIGPNVDKIMEGQLADFPTGRFDVCLSAECFEHNPFWLETFINMARMTKQGGLIIITCATTGRGEHGTHRSGPGSSPFTVEKGWNYYKNLTEKDFASRIDLKNWFDDWRFDADYVPHDLYFVGLRKQTPPAKLPASLTEALRIQNSPYRSLKAFRRSIKARVKETFTFKR
jgi:SAM-dependent methyltransferase